MNLSKLSLCVIQAMLLGLPAQPSLSAALSSPEGKVQDFSEPGAFQKLAPREQPAWRRDMARWEWKRIPGSDLNRVRPSVAVPGNLRARIDAWNGLAGDGRTGRLFSAANGGHADYAGNEVYEIDLRADAPTWELLREPTPPEAILASDYSSRTYHDYYRDGRPASTHTYYALQYLSSRNAVFKFGAGSLWGSGNEANWKIDAFSLADNDWHPAGTWSDIVESRRGVISASVCTNPITEQVYIAAPDRLQRFDPRTGKVEALAKWDQNSSAVQGRGCAVDWQRQRVVFFGDAYRRPNGGIVYDIRTDAMTPVRFEGEHGAEIARRNAHYAWYEPALEAFLLKTAQGDGVYAIDADDYSVRKLETRGGEDLPDAVNGVQTRWQRLPLLGGYAYYPRSGSGVWFLAIE